MMKIRQATTNDMTSLLSLVSELGYLSSLDILTYRLEKFLQNPGYDVVVCEINQDIAGLVAWSKSNLFVEDKTRFHIEALVVADEYRGKTIGRSLMGFVEEIG